ncbi:MAG: hypothetical protein ACKOD9_00370, partial [Rubrivivax sp.]
MKDALSPSPVAAGDMGSAAFPASGLFTRRAWLLQGVARASTAATSAASIAAGLLPDAHAATATAVDPVRRGRLLTFPRDHGAHPGSRIEWWYLTGWLQ